MNGSYLTRLPRCERGTMSTTIVAVLTASALIAIGAFFLFSPLIGRTLADKAIEPICLKEAGIRVAVPVQLEKGEFPSIDPVDRSGEVVGTILNKYRVVRRHEFKRMYSAAVYKYVTGIERISDGARLAEMTQFFREGDEVFHGKFCPANISERDLVLATFRMPEGKVATSGTYPNCEGLGTEKIILAKTGSSPATPVKGIKPDIRDPKWQRHLSCQGKTEIDNIYSTVGPGETRLTGTRLLFDGKDGKRCQAQAMAAPDRIICTSDGIYLIGRKTISYHDDISVEKFSVNGSLMLDVSIEQTSQGPGRIVGYQETTDQLAIDFLSIEGERARCQSIVARKSGEFRSTLLPTQQDFSQYLPGCAGL